MTEPGTVERRWVMNDQSSVIVLGDGAGREYPCGTIRAVFKADGPETADRYSISEWWLEPGSQGPGEHRHEANDDTFYVLSGTATFVLDGDVVTVGPGSFVRVPHRPCRTTTATTRTSLFACSTSTCPAASSRRCRRSSPGSPTTRPRRRRRPAHVGKIRVRRRHESSPDAEMTRIFPRCGSAGCHRPPWRSGEAKTPPWGSPSSISPNSAANSSASSWGVYPSRLAGSVDHHERRLCDTP